MAKAVFHKNQRVYVKPVGTWAQIERIKPIWVKDVEEPVRIFYDVGLGRDFSAEELSRESKVDAPVDASQENWRLIRAPNKWQNTDETSSHPHPGTFPIIVTDPKDWGGWRVPGAEYDRDPERIERQARIISQSIHLLSLARALDDAARLGADLPDELTGSAKIAGDILRFIDAVAEGASPTARTEPKTRPQPLAASGATDTTRRPSRGFG